MLVALGNGIQAGFTEQFSSLTTQITVTRPRATGRRSRLTEDDMEALTDRALAPDVAIGHAAGDGQRAAAAAGPGGYRTSDHRHDGELR